MLLLLLSFLFTCCLHISYWAAKLPSHSHSNTPVSTVSTLQSQIWWTYFFIQVTLWKIEKNEEEICKISVCLLYKLFQVKWAKEKFCRKNSVRVVLVTSSNTLLVSEKLGATYSIIVIFCLFFWFFVNFDFLINSKPKPRPHRKKSMDTAALAFCCSSLIP